MSARSTILILDDDEGLRTQYRWLLSAHEVVEAASRPEAVAAMKRAQPALAIVDLGLPPDPDGASEGLAAVDNLLSITPSAKILVVTGNDNREYALKAVASGAYDFLNKPVDPDVLTLSVERALRLRELEEENRRLSAKVSGSPVSEIVTNSQKMMQLLRQVERVAKTDIAALILGESGTGKEMIARALHNLSHRAGKPFVEINCAAIPESLLEAELFGHEKGAFTGAIRQNIGRIESAHQGTLFLDEIGDVPLSMQVKLLRFLQTHVVERVGGRTQIKLDVRVVCATNRDLTKLIAEGKFREDLYFRIDEATLHLPPLRDREGDAVLLANFFLKKYTAQYKGSVKSFTADAVLALQEHEWTGNVRELENKVKRAVVMSEGAQVRPEDLDLVSGKRDVSMNLRDIRRRAERNALEIALAQSPGNMAKAAKLLEISRPTLYDLLNEHGIASATRKKLREARDPED